MASVRRAPSSGHTLRAIARRQIVLASRRKLVKLLFLFSILPPLLLTVTVVVRIMAEQASGFQLDWDPLMHFLEFQALPVGLLALGLGTPAVAQDRSEDVLFLYATRPVLPWHYALGKMLAVAIPAAGLMLLPGLLIPALRLAVTAELSVLQALYMAAKMLLVSVMMGAAYAGLTVGASSVTKRGRWALLIALAFFILPDALIGLSALLLNFDAWELGPQTCVIALMKDLFSDGENGLRCVLVLLAYAGLGFWTTLSRVKREMIP